MDAIRQICARRRLVAICCWYSILICLFSRRTTAQWSPLYWPHNDGGDDPNGIETGVNHVAPLSRAAHGLVVFQDNLYIFGGIGDTAAVQDYEYNDTWRFDLVDKTWTLLTFTAVDTSTASSHGPSPRFHHGTAVHSNGSVAEMVIFGGLSIATRTSPGGVLAPPGSDIKITQFNEIWRLSLTTKGAEQWHLDPPSSSSPEDTASEPTPRSEAGVAVHANQLYTFGGISYDEAAAAVTPPIDYNELWRYDLAACTWSEIIPTDNVRPPTRFSHAISIFSTSTSSDSDGNKAATIADEGIEVDDQADVYLLVYSGRHLGSTSWRLLEDAWLFSLTTQRWIELRISTPMPRAYTSVITISGVNPAMWFFGGYYKSLQSTSGYVYDDIVKGQFEISTEDDHGDSDNKNNNQRGSISMEMFQGSQEPVNTRPALRYNHQTALWRDTLILHGGSYQTQRGDLWFYNLTTATLTDFSATGLPLDVQTIIYVLAILVIVIAVVLVALIARWRRADRQNTEQARMRGVAVIQGVAKERLDRMAITKYRRPDTEEDGEGKWVKRNTPVDGTGDHTTEEDVCPICLIEFEVDEEVRNLPCKHLFHVACIDEWLKRNTTCPMCKNNLDLEVEDVERERLPATTPAAPRAATTARRTSSPSLRGGAIVAPSIDPET